MPADKLSIEQFAQKIKEKYPQYKDINDTILAQKMVEKYPQYSSRVDLPSATPIDKGVRDGDQAMRQPLEFNGTFKPDLEGEQKGLYLNDADYQSKIKDFKSRILADDQGNLMYPEKDDKTGQWTNYYTGKPIPNFDPKVMQGAIIQVPSSHLDRTAGQRFITPVYNPKTNSYDFPNVEKPEAPPLETMPEATVYGSKEHHIDNSLYDNASTEVKSIINESDKQGGQFRQVLKNHPELSTDIDDALKKYGDPYKESLKTGSQSMSNVIEKAVAEKYNLNKPLPSNIDGQILNGHLNVLNNFEKNKNDFESNQRELQHQADLLTDRAKRTGQPVNPEDAERLAQKAASNIQNWNTYTKSVQFSQNYVNQPAVKSYLGEFKKRQQGIQLLDEVKQRAFPEDISAQMKQNVYDRRAIEGNLNAWDYTKTALGAAGRGLSNIGESVVKMGLAATPGGIGLLVPGINSKAEAVNANAQRFIGANLPAISPEAMEQISKGKGGSSLLVNDIASTLGGFAPYIIPGAAGEGMAGRAATFATALAEQLPTARIEAEKQGLTGAAYNTYVAAKPLVSAAFMTLLPNVKFAKGVENDVAKAVIDGEFNNPKRALLNIASKVLKDPGDIAHLQAMLSGTALGEAVVNRVTNALQAKEDIDRGISRKEGLPVELSNVFNPRQTVVMALAGKAIEGLTSALKQGYNGVKYKEVNEFYDNAKNNLIELAANNLEGVSKKVDELVKKDPGNVYAQHLKNTIQDFAYAEARMPDGIEPEQKAALFDLQQKVSELNRQSATSDPVYKPYIQKNIDELNKQISEILKDPKKANDYLKDAHKEFAESILSPKTEVDEKAEANGIPEAEGREGQIIEKPTEGAATPIEGAAPSLETSTTKTEPDAIQIGSPEEILQRQPEEAGSAGGERGGMEPSQQGGEPTGEGGAAQKEGEATGKEIKVGDTIYSKHFDGVRKVVDVSEDGAKLFVEGEDGEMKEVPAEDAGRVRLSGDRKAAFADKGVEHAIEEWPFVEEEGDNEFTSTRNAVTRQKVEDAGLEPAMEEAARDFGSVWQEAQKKINKGSVDVQKLISQLDKKPRAVTDLENAMILYHQNVKESQLDAASKDLDQARKVGDKQLWKEAYDTRARLLDELQQIYNVDKAIGRETARGLNARKMMADRRFSLVNMQLEKRSANGGEPLTEKQEDALKDQYEEIKKTKEAYEARIEELTKENARIKAEKSVSESKKGGKTKKTKDQFKQERKDIVQQMRDDLLRAAKGGEGLTSSIPLAAQLTAVAPHVAKLVKSFVEEGVDRLEDITKNIHDILKPVIPDIEDRHIHDLIAGEYNEKVAAAQKEPSAYQQIKEQAKAQKYRVTDPKLMKLQADYERAKDKYQQSLQVDERKSRTGLQKTQDAFLKYERFAKLSNPITLGKLTMAAITRLATTPVEEGVGAAYSKILPGIAKKAPGEAGINVSALAKGYRETFMRGLDDAATVAKGGKTDIEAIYGKKGHLPPEAIDFFGQLHSAIKAPVKRFAFARSFQKRMANNIKNGVTVDGMVEARIAMEAYKDAERSIFMQDNPISKGWTTAMGVLERSGDTGKLAATIGQWLIPFVKVPTNIIGETITHVAGPEIALAKIISTGLGKGLKNLSQDEAESIMRNLKKGTIGHVALMAGYLNPQAFGGYYQKGEKRDKEDVKPGDIKVLGHTIPAWAIEAPIFQAMQLGATVRRIKDTMIKGQEKGIGEGIWGGALGLMSHEPLLDEPSRIMSALESEKERQYFLGELAKSTLVPAMVDYTAKVLDPLDDRSIPEKIIEPENKRQPKTVLEHVESAIPGMRENVTEKKPTSKGSRRQRKPR